MSSTVRKLITGTNALVLFFAVACGQTHSDRGSHTDPTSQAGQDFRGFDPDAGTPSDNQPTNVSSSAPGCPVGEIAAGVAELEIYSDSLGGELPVSFSAHCGRPDAALDLMATDGLSTFRVATAEPGRGDMDAQGSFEFEDLATFAGHCNVCLEDRAGTLSCSSLIWKTGDELVKASVTGTFRCDPAE